MSILVVTSEAHPFASTGGLAEVAAALPQALAASGHDVTIVLPRYRGVDVAGTAAIRLSFRMGAATLSISVLERTLENGVRLALVEAPDLFDREELYGDANGDYADNAWRFAVFSRAALEYARATGVRPSIIHAHDWQAGLVPVYQKMLFSPDPVVGGVPVVFTIHNLAFQGLFPAGTVDAIGLGWDVLDVQAMEYWGQVSYLKAGINFSEAVTTVSPSYASEITSPELGFGFDGILRRRAAALVGILNGIDTERWNPAADDYVPATFTADDLSGKQAAKKALLEATGLATDARAMARPIIGLVSRLTDQKGFDLMAAAADELMSLDASWVLLGSGEGRYEELWRSLAARNSGRVSATIGFDERLNHLIEAGADMFLMPSRFEPCGLNQMYSLRYGTLPIVRATGGLRDTVEDAGQGGTGTGFVFTQYTPGALVDAIRRALAAYRSPDLWRGIQRRAMRQDHSWDASAREYVKVYRALLAGALERSSASAVSVAPTDR
ncbi:MAG: glycogen synthase GlgA [Vicinamibacterales bacterium]